jgi:hypothetical protein
MKFVYITVQEMNDILARAEDLAELGFATSADADAAAQRAIGITLGFGATCTGWPPALLEPLELRIVSKIPATGRWP